MFGAENHFQLNCPWLTVEVSIPVSREESLGKNETISTRNLRFTHRNQTISRRWANIISRRPSHGHLARRCCPQAFLRIFSEVTYIRTV
jgi:hypothetical protein